LTITFVAILSFVAFSAGVLKSGFAVGAGIFLTPILTLVMGPKEAVALVASMMLFTDIIAIFQYWKQWHARDIFYLALPCIIGAVLGAMLLHWFSPTMAKRAIGIIGFIYIASELFRIFIQKTVRSPTAIRSISIGIIGGITSSLANSGSVFISTYVAGRLSKQLFVGTLVVVFVGINLTKVVMFSALGILEARLWLTSLLLLPLIITGGMLGKWVNYQVNEKQFKQWIFILIAVACLKLLFFS
jgi:uncharacterized membrane protein YfcA